MFIPVLERGQLKTFSISTPYLVTHHWKGLIIIKTMLRRKGYYDFPGKSSAFGYLLKFK